MSSTTPSKAPAPIGEKLRDARLDRQLSLEETAWRTRIRPDLLRALEQGDFEEIGHPSFVRSHLTSYARFLGIDHLAIVDELDAMQGEHVPSAIEELDRQRRESRKPPRAKWLIAAAVSAAVLVIASLAGLVGEEAAAPEPLPPVAIEASGPVPPAEARVRMRVMALEATQVSIIADGDDVFEGPLEAGEERSFRARESLEVLAADAGAIALTLNGRDLGTPGASGEIYRARFGPDGVVDE